MTETRYRQELALERHKRIEAESRAEAAEKERDHNWQEYLAERTARMEANGREAAWQARAEAAEKRAMPHEPTDAMLEAMWNAMFAEPFDATTLPMLGAGYDALRAALEAKP